MSLRNSWAGRNSDSTLPTCLIYLLHFIGFNALLLRRCKQCCNTFFVCCNTLSLAVRVIYNVSHHFIPIDWLSMLRRQIFNQTLTHLKGKVVSLTLNNIYWCARELWNAVFCQSHIERPFERLTRKATCLVGLYISFKLTILKILGIHHINIFI